MAKSHTESFLLKNLSASLSTVTECLLALVGNILPVASLYLIAGEELRAHTYAEYAGLEPLGQVLFLGSYATSNHDLRPRHGSHQTLDEVRTNYVAREYLGEVAAYLLSLTDFRWCQTTWAVSHATTIADNCDVGVEQRTNHEVGTQLDVQ
jgi:hypothetical protein